MISTQKVQKIGVWLIFLLATSPIWYVSLTMFPKAYGKIPFFLLGIALLATLFLLSKSTSKIVVNTWGRRLDFAFLLFLGSTLLTTIFSQDFAISFWGTNSRGDGFVILLALVVWYFLLRTWLTEKTWRIFWWVVLGAGVVSAFVVFAEAFIPGVQSFFGETGRFSGLFGNPIFLAGFLLLLCFIVFLQFSKSTRRARIILSGILILFVFAILLTGSRGPFLGLVAGSVTTFFILIKLKRSFSWQITAGIAFIGIASIVAFILFAPRILTIPELPPSIQRVFNIESYSGNARLIGWQIAFDSFKEKPILGWGPGNFQMAFDRHYRPELLDIAIFETVSDKPHNLIFEILSTGGIVLFAAFILVYVVMSLAIFAKDNRVLLRPLEIAAIAGAIIAYLVHTSFLFDIFPTSLIIFSLLAWVASSGGRATTDESLTSSRVHTSLVNGVVIACIPLAIIAGPGTLPASFSMLRTVESRSSSDWIRWAEPARALPTVHHREMLKYLSRDLIQKEASGVLSETFIKSQLPPILEEMEFIANKYDGDFTLYFLLGQLLTMKGQYLGSAEALHDAVEKFDHAYSLSPNRQVVPLQLAKVLLIQGNNKDAVELLRAVVEDNPDAYEPHWFLGLALVVSGEKALGADELMRAVVIEGGSERNIQYVLDLLVEQERDEDIAVVYELITRSYPENAKYHANLAATYAKLGKNEQAILEAQRAVELDPSYQAEIESFIKSLQNNE